MNVLVTGGAGYLGSVLVPMLLAREHRVRVLDIGFRGFAHLRPYLSREELIRDDIGRISKDSRFRDELLENVDCIIHLAAVSSDSLADSNPELTEEVNFQSTLKLAEIARARRIRFLFSSSCSIYGEAHGELTESSTLNPLSAHAVSKAKAESALKGLSGEGWRPISLRNGTLFGCSPRMRFDLVVNTFALSSATRGTINILGLGLQWRPYLHVKDCARAFLHFAETPASHDSIYNIAHDNLRVVDVAAIFKDLNPRLKLVHLDVSGADRRNYRVASERMRQDGFQSYLSVQSGAATMVEAIVAGSILVPAKTV